MGRPAARVTDLHTCPMVTPGSPPIPHVGGPIRPMCSTNVITGGLPQARVTDMSLCAGPQDMIVQGSATVLVNGLPAARIGDRTSHGGIIVTGCPTVLIGDQGGGGGRTGGGAGAAGDGDFGHLLSTASALNDAAAQAKTLIEAAEAGTPFCEVCSRA